LSIHARVLLHCSNNSNNTICSVMNLFKWQYIIIRKLRQIRLGLIQINKLVFKVARIRLSYLFFEYMVLIQVQLRNKCENPILNDTFQTIFDLT